MKTQIITTQHKNRVNIQTIGKMDLREETISPNNTNESYRKILSAKIGIEKQKIFLLNQVHGNDFFDTKDILKSNRIMDGDGLFTFNPREVLVIKTADCIPIFFWSYSEPFIGVLHAGWKGMKEQIAEKFVEFICKNFPKADLNIYIGPCIRKMRYQVRDDVAQYFKDGLGGGLILEKENQYYLGLDEILKSRLKNQNIFIQDCNICTYSNPNYYSYRRGDVERNLNFIYLS